MCSYAGPNWRDHPYEPASSETRIWACDACRGGELHHYGIVVLWESNKVNFIDIEELEGQEEDRIVVGPGSGDPRLATMTFHPRQ